MKRSRSTDRTTWTSGARPVTPRLSTTVIPVVCAPVVSIETCRWSTRTAIVGSIATAIVTGSGRSNPSMWVTERQNSTS